MWCLAASLLLMGDAPLDQVLRLGLEDTRHHLGAPYRIQGAVTPSVQIQ
jgi:hypothetical protein